MKRNIVIIITFLAGLFFLLEFMIPAEDSPWLCDLQDSLSRLHARLGGTESWLSPVFRATDSVLLWLGSRENILSVQFGTVNNFLLVLGTMAFLIGPINLTRGELTQIIRRRKGWYESVVYVVALLIGLAAAGFRSDTPPDSFTRVMSVTYDAILFGVSLAFYITSMGLVSFYLVSAAHRAFLLNTLESALMMVAASIVMLGLTPAGDYLNQFLPSWLQIGSVAQWILSTPNTAVQKAVLFGACGGAFVAAMRNWLSIGKSGE